MKLLAASFIKFTIHNGKNTRFWFDMWTPFGSLISFIGEGGPRLLRVPLNACVSEVCEENRWSLPSPRSDNSLALHIYHTTIPVPNPLDDDDVVS